jgi:anti-sigma regulatory factor (Ser/Thr protein kinase)
VPSSYEPSRSFTIRNEIGDLAIVRDGLNRFCAEHAVAENTETQLQVALDEIVSNIIKYAWPEGGSHELSVSMSADATSIRMEVVDDGCAFDPLTVAPPEEPPPGAERRPGGLGIHMTRQLVDDIACFRENERNHVLLTKRYERRAVKSGEN